jgi:hypothetical protein
MYHFDYVGSNGGTVFTDYRNGSPISINGIRKFSLDGFLDFFISIKNSRGPFTMTVYEKRFKGVARKLEKYGYAPFHIEQLNDDLGEYNAHTYGFYYINGTCPFV